MGPGHRHRRGVVRFGLDPRFRAGTAAGAAMAGLALSRRLGPASRLVPFVALESGRPPGRAPYDAVLTHGFVLDEAGRKMSKSLGNVTAPQDVMKQSGADILRLWVVASDYAEDLRIGPEILKHMGDAYRRLRNTLRYLLGALAGYTPAEAVGPQDMPELERWVLHRLAELD